MARLHGSRGQRTPELTRNKDAARMTVGFIGLGRMGGPMAVRIAAAGHRVLGYDIVPAKCQIPMPGVSRCESPAEVASGSDVVITSLPGPAQVSEVVNGSNGLLKSLRPSTIMVETSTISPDLSRAIARTFSARNSYYLDAPVSGGAGGAREGTLIAMVGGPVEALEGVRPIISCFAREIFHLGPVGSGNLMKLVIQSIFLSQMASFLEAVSMGERSGIPLDTLLEIVASSSAHHPAIGTRYGKLKSGDTDPMFEIASAVKDLSLAERVWENFERRSPILSAALSDYRRAAAEGFGRADLIALRNCLNRETTERN
jgi:3-hydroxyisobutyrate dehydrogenase-like beta-hydroxyacid dehydrogenase